MQNAIKRHIKQLCAKAFKRAQDQKDKQAEYADKFTKRTGKAAGTAQLAPTYPHKHFDPVYCKRHANFIAKSIWLKIQRGDYQPEPALRFEVPKPAGGTRTIMQFSIPDSAVASVLNRRLTLRNLKNQSGNSFAYRPDKNVFDAILKIKSAIKQERNFAIQLDFENYFDSIPHPYIQALLASREILIISAAEREVIRSFLVHRHADKSEFAKGIFTRRDKGTPQGSAISLALANLANHPLDCKLEAINGQFSRYADDTVVICYRYEDALEAHRVFIDHCSDSGLKLNKKKSPGIWILSDHQEEFRTITDFKFLGYGIATNGLYRRRRLPGDGAPGESAGRVRAVAGHDSIVQPTHCRRANGWSLSADSIGPRLQPRQSAPGVLGSGHGTLNQKCSRGDKRNHLRASDRRGQPRHGYAAGPPTMEDTGFSGALASGA